MRFIFPDAEVTVLDVVDGVLDEVRRVHGYETIKGTPEGIDIGSVGQFDFLIARDVIEHTIHCGKVLSNVYRLLGPGGYFHFLIPNGPEDVWGAYARCRLTGEPAEVLLNHVNYFNPMGLERYLHRLGFETVNYYLDSIKSTRRGKGWRVNEKMAATPSRHRSAQVAIESAADRVTTGQFDKPDISKQWWFRPRQKWIATTYCKFKNFNFIRVPGHLDIGHEINGLMRKTDTFVE